MAHIMDTRPTIPRGWECPKCHAVYAPWMLSCLTCQPSMLRLAGAPAIQPAPAAEPDAGPVLRLPEYMGRPDMIHKSLVPVDWREVFPGLQARYASRVEGQASIDFRLTPPDGQARD